MSLQSIGQIAVNAKDVARATVFYKNVLGMNFLFSAPPGLAFFDCGGVRLMISKAEKPEFDHPASIIYYKVPDIEKSHAELLERGVAFEEKPHLVAPMSAYDLWMASFRDSEGNLLALMSEKAKA